METRIPRALTIAGSDSSGGAGIQADIKTFTTLKVYGQSVVTSLTAQNTIGVSSVFSLPPGFVESQFDAVMEDIGCDAAKIGMLSDRGIVKAVSGKLSQYGITMTVLDPVMVSKSGHRLLSEDAVSELANSLIPMCYVVTPNIPEAEALTGIRITDPDSMKKAAEDIKRLGCGYVLITGGHLEDTEHSTDILFDGKGFREYKTKRVMTRNTHGTGCTVSSAICAYLARGFGLEDAVERAKNYIFQAISTNPDLGKGNGPLNHMWDLD